MCVVQLDVHRVPETPRHCADIDGNTVKLFLKMCNTRKMVNNDAIRPGVIL